jgi:hypothetical protein
MGLIMVTVPLARAARDGEALQRAVWDRAAEHIAWRMLSSRAARKIMSSYAALQASDGFSNRDWYATKSGLHYAFSDAAGLCVCESNAVWHWLRLAVLDLWSDLETIVEDAGAALGAPGEVLGSADDSANASTLLKAALTSKESSVLFPKGTALAYASQADAPESDHQVFLVGKTTTLGRIPAADRGRARDVIAGGVCLCEACEKLRAMHDLKAAAPKGGKAKANIEAPIAEGPPLSSAKVVRAEELKRVDPKTVVALDLGVAPFSNDSPSSTALAMLPSMPLRALSLRRAKMRVVPKEVLASAGLEVLDLAFTGRVRFPNALASLSRLRGFSYTPSPRGTASEDKALLCRIPSLEIIDGPSWGPSSPVALREMTRFRHLEVSPTDGKFPLAAEMRLDSVITDGPFRELEECALRYFEGPLAALPSSVSNLEVVSTRDPLPAKRMPLPKLRALQASGDLPDWLAELPALELLHVHGKGDVSVIARLPSLRCLIIGAATLASANLDFRRLSSLRLLAIIGSLPRTERVPDLRPLERLAEVSYAPAEHEGGVTRDELAKVMPTTSRLADAEAGWAHWRPLTWYRALYTTRESPEWWLTRFWYEDEIERLAAMLS